jgi:hypothetical protein
MPTETANLQTNKGIINRKEILKKSKPDIDKCMDRS